MKTIKFLFVSFLVVLFLNSFLVKHHNLYFFSVNFANAEESDPEIIFSEEENIEKDKLSVSKNKKSNKKYIYGILGAVLLGGAIAALAGGGGGDDDGGGGDGGGGDDNSGDSVSINW